MKKILYLTIVSLMLTGCVAVPVYDSGYYYPYQRPYASPYLYVGPDITVFVPGVHFGHGYYGSYGFHGGRR